MSTQNYAPLSQLDAQVQNDLNTGNYGDAFSLAQNQQVGMFGNKDQSQTDYSVAPGQRNVNTPARPSVNPDWAAAYGTDPKANLLTQLETPQGLQYLDPSKQWSQSDVNNYYSAAAKAAQGATGAPMGSAASQALGGDPSTGQLWGDPSKFSSDATANWNADPNSAPNLSQFASKNPSQSFAEKYAIPLFDAAYLGIATAGIGSGVGAALGGGLGGAIGGGAAAGAAGAIGHDAMTGQPLTLGSVGEGALGGGLTGGLGYEAQPLTGAISDATGLSAPVSAGLVKGEIGAGVGALGADLSGQNVGNAALTGGAGGFASGAIGNLTGNSYLGAGAGTIAGDLASKYLTSPSSPSSPAIPAAVAAPAATAPTQSASPVAAAAPVTVVPQSVGQATPTPAPANSTTGIGSYPGLGYQPMTQVNPGIANYNTYGQGPQASFFAPVQGT